MEEKDNALLRSIQTQMQSWLEEMEKNGHQVTEQEYEDQIEKVMEAHLDFPDPDFNGFTTLQMRSLVQTPLGEGCPVQLNQLSEEQISQIPIMRQALHLMNALEENEIKLTAKGYIPPKMVEELYNMGSKGYVTEMYNQRIEPRCAEVQILRIALIGSGLVKTRLGKMSLTAKGKKLLKDHNVLTRAIMHYLFTDYDTGSLDTAEDAKSGNFGRAYSLWLLHHYGNQWRNVGFYEYKYDTAFPNLNCYRHYSYRVFNRLFFLIGVCEFNENHNFFHDEKVRKTPILDMMFSFEEPAGI